MRKLVFLAALISITIPIVAEPQVDSSKRAPTISTAGAEAQKTDSANSGAVSASKNSENRPLASGVVLRTTARLVDVGVVAYDKKGHPAVDLNPDDFQIFDNGRRQQLKFFSASGPSPAIDLPLDHSKALLNPDQTHRDGPGASVGAADANKTEGTTTVLLIDSQNLAWDDLSYARQEVLRFLGHLPASDRAGIYIMKETGVQILAEPSADHAHVAEVFRKWMPGARELAHAQEEERRIRQQFDTVRHPNDLAQVNGNAAYAQELYAPLEGATQNTVDVASPMATDIQLRSFAGNPERTALSLLELAAHHLETIPGHKNLVWIASDNVLADWNNHPEVTEKGSKALDPFAVKVQETLNDAHVSIYPLDASQLEAGSIGANLGNRNVTAVGYTERSASFADQGSGLNPGRITAQVQEDVHPIQGIYREVSEATGGRTLRRSGDLAAELNGVVADGQAAYILSFTPDTQADGTYHQLAVKLTFRKNITLRYRATYFYHP
jgi:VWFA-related protein